MSPPGRPKGEYRSARHEGTPVRSPAQLAARFGSRQLLKALGRGRALIFVFHGVPGTRIDARTGQPAVEVFERTLDFIAGHFSVIPLADCVDRLAQQRALDGCACITFDDGYDNWCSTVVPVLSKRGLPACFFITTDQLGGQPLWTERIAQAVSLHPPGELRLSHAAWMPMPLAEEGDRSLAAHRVATFLKYLRLPVRNALIEEIEHGAGCSPRSVPHLSTEQVAAIHSQGFDIGAHTRAHPILTVCDEEEARAEIQGSRDALQSVIDAEVGLFAYPNGKPTADYSLRDARLVQEAGYRAAVSSSAGTLRADTPIFQLPRVSLWAKNESSMLRQVVGAMLTPAETAVAV
jgi:peptidoglycan/xylan/chitin deacetylase (PgdA/CDA1 family)